MDNNSNTAAWVIGIIIIILILLGIWWYASSNHQGTATPPAQTIPAQTQTQTAPTTGVQTSVGASTTQY